MPEDYEKKYVTKLFAGSAGKIFESLDTAKFLIINSHPSGSLYDPQLVKIRLDRLAMYAENPDVPPYAQQAIKRYLADPANLQQAIGALTDAENAYHEIFSNFGITPKDERV